MKRSSSDLSSATPPSSSPSIAASQMNQERHIDRKPQIAREQEQPSTPLKKRKTASKGESGGGGMDAWTTKKREEFMIEIFTSGVKAAGGSGQLAKKYGVSISNMSHAIQAGRKGNFRDKAIKAVVGEEAT